MNIGLVYNLKKNVVVSADAPPDALAEYDSPETVNALEQALQQRGHTVVRLEADETFLDTVRAAKPDICFNIAEGLQGDSRESQIPAVLEMLGIPYTASNVLTHAISLDKGMTKHVWQNHGLPTAPFQTFYHPDAPLSPELNFPLFVKPVREGTGMGINQNSIVHDMESLRTQITWVLETYHQPALVEAFLSGREFTVGVIGNRFSSPTRLANPLYEADGFHVFPVLEIDSQNSAGDGLYNTAAKSFLPDEAGAPAYLCPADISPTLQIQLRQLVVGAFEAIGGYDVGRVDVRLDEEGSPFLIEINTLPGLNPVYSDLCIIAKAEGMSYENLINEILTLALERYAML